MLLGDRAIAQIRFGFLNGSGGFLGITCRENTILDDGGIPVLRSHCQPAVRGNNLASRATKLPS